MAKKSKEQEQSPKKFIQDKIVTHLLQEFQQLESLVGKKEFAKRLKKSAKLITQGLTFEEATKEEATAEVKSEAKEPKVASKKAKAAPKKFIRSADGVKAAPKKSAKGRTGAKPAVKKAKSKPAA